ncbi:HNH endonuclease [Listeria sp. FSL L7-1582]|nr:HNH endonuclease [Listeria portnoyi]
MFGGSDGVIEKASGAVDDIPTAFKQKEFASSYEARLGQTPALQNKKIQFVSERGESLCTLKPPPDSNLESLLKDADVEGVYYKNGVPDFSPFSKAEIEIDHMHGGKGSMGSKARDLNFKQANLKLVEQLNKSPELAKSFGMEAGNIKPKDIEKYRVKNKLTWHELNDTKTMQLVPSEINRSFGHLGGVGEINAGAVIK